MLELKLNRKEKNQMPKSNEEFYNKKITDDAKKAPENKDKELSDKEKMENKGDELGINLQALTSQIQAEYDVAWKHQKPKKDKYLVRLKLMNNQKRDPEAVGDTTLFSTFQTVLASLYNDKMSVDFRGREDGDEGTADNLNSLALADYDDMEKDQTDYYWDWDACFCGRGLLLMEEFIRDPEKNEFLPLPENLDFITWLRDPAAKSVNGNRKGKGSMRFGGNELKMSKFEMKDHPSFFKDIKFEELKYGSSTYSLLEDAVTARDEAQGNNSVNKESEGNFGVNAQYSVTQWFTHAEVKGKIKKVKVWLANERSKIVGIKVLERDYWPILDRPLYPHSHDWDGTSICDLVEDKQRARAILQNLGLQSSKADVDAVYLYDTNKIKNRNDLNFKMNKFIGVDTVPGEPVGNSLMPINKARPNLNLISFIYQTLDASAQKATATPEIKQGVQSSEKRTLGENNLLASGSDTRYSLAAKVFGWSEKRFWQQWYNMYKDNFADDIDEKIIRTVGAFGSKWRPLTKEQIICRLDPDVYIESKAVSRAKDLEDRAMLTGFFGTALADPSTNRRYGLKRLARMNGMQKDEIDRLFPPTVDERIAEQQNVMLDQNKTQPVLPEDDHNVHLEVHASAKQTAATMAHIQTHIRALSIKKVKPELFPAQTDSTNMNTPATGANVPTTQPSSSTITPSQTSNLA